MPDNQQTWDKLLESKIQIVEATTLKWHVIILYQSTFAAGLFEFYV